MVLPIYNAERYLDQALRSVRDQTLSAIEILCINDGSTDSSLDILHRHQAEDDRIRIIDGPNAGYGHAMNLGIDNATGKYLGILEPDDYILPTMYEKLCARAEQDGLDFVRSDFHRFTTGADGSECRWVEYVCPRQTYYNATLNPQLNHQLFIEAQMQNWTGVYNMAFVRHHEIRFNESAGASFQDNGFWFQTYCWATRVAYLNEPFYCHRNDNAASSTNQPDKAMAMLDEYSWIRSWLREHPPIEQTYTTIYQYKKTHNAMFAFSKLAPHLRLSFLERYAQETKEALEAGEIDQSLFWPEEWQQLMNITVDPRTFAEQYDRNRQSTSASTEAYPILRRFKHALRKLSGW